MRTMQTAGNVSHHARATIRRRQRLRAVALGSLLAIGLLAAHPAGAEPPITTVTTFDRTFTFACPQGFTLIEHYQGTETIRRFRDGSQQTHIRLLSEFTNDVTGERLRSVTPSLFTFSLDTISVVGVTFRVNEPGEGIVSLAAGRLVYDRETGTTVFDSGPSDSRPNLCRVLSD